MTESPENVNRWLNIGLELVSKPGFSTIPTFLYSCERILADTKYDARFRKSRSSLGIQSVQTALQALSTNKQTTYGEFQKEMENQLDAIGKKQIKKFTVAFPLPFRFPSSVTLRASDSVNKRSIDVLDYSSFDSAFMKNIDLKKVGLSNDTKQWVALVQTSRVLILGSYARDPFFAFLDTIPTAKEWTALLSYSQASIIGVAYPPVPFTSIKLPQFGMVFDGNVFVESYGGDYPLPQEGHAGVMKIDNFYKIADIVEKLPDLTIKKIIRDAISVYAEAVTESEKGYAFLKFWIGVELMVRLKSKIPDEKVATRIKQMFFLEKPETFDSQVETFLSKRNLILHEGDLETIQWYDIIFAKQLYEEILELLMRFCHASLDLDWIEPYYDSAGKTVESLDETRKAIEFLIKQKTGKT